MKQIFQFILPVAVLFSGGVYASEKGELVSYECTVRIFATDLPEGFSEQKFSRPVSGGDHGGKGLDLVFGEHRISIMADGRWRNVSWWHNGVLLGATVTAGELLIAGHQALVIYNPANTDEQVAVDCTPIFAASTSETGS